MKKTFLFLAALAMSAMMMAAEKTLTFDLTSNPGGWPTTNSTTPTDYTYTLDDVDYTFVLKNVKSNSGYLMMTQPASLGLPAIEGYKLTKVVAKNTSGCSTSVEVGISSSATEANYISGGEALKWATQGTSYTYTLSETSENTVYYIYVTKKNAQITELALTYANGTTPQRELKSIYISGTAEKLEYFVGEEFDPAGLKVMGKYDTGDDTEITACIVWTIDPETLALGTISVDVTAQYKDFTSEVFTVNNIVVKEKVVPTGYAGTYTSNVELTTEGGSSASAAKVIIGGTEYDAIKAGTGKVAGACVVTIPAATKMLHFHAVGWKGANVTLDINGEALNITSEDGISNNTPFTLQGTASDYYYAIDPKGKTTITFTATAGFRFVLFGVNAELAEGVVAAPTFTPTESEFDKEVMVTLTADEGADIYYTLDGTTPSNASTKYEAPFKLTATTTVKAIAIKGDKSSEVAEKTYTLIPAYTLAEIAAITPANQKAVLVLDNDEIVEVYTKEGKEGLSGVYFQVGEKKIELYNQNYAFPKTWEVGGKLTGRVIGEWADFNGQWELKIATEEIDKLSYTAPVQTAKLESITLSLDKETLYQNEEFKYSGTVTANYDDQSTKDVTDQVTYKGYDMAVLGEQTVTVSYTEGEITKEAAYTLTVAEKVVPTGYAGTYTSNVELTTEGGSSAYAAKVIFGGTEYDAIKCGTSSIAGACVITIPAATKTLHFHAAGWNKESVVLNESINLVADAGVSGISPFTLQNDPATQDYFTLDPKGATTITFTATTGKRFVLFGVNAELAEGVVAAPTFTPTESEFDKEVMVTLSAEGADIYYTLDGTTPSNASTKYEVPFKLTATTTVKAIAIKGDKSSEVAEKTYTLIPSFESLEDLVTKQPATETNVTVIVTITEASVDSFYVTSKGQKNGIYTHVGETVVELYLYDVPETWVVGGKVSGKIQAQWGLYKGTAELQQWEGGWNAFSYTAPGPITNLQELMQDNIVRKVLVNGHLVIIKDNQLFNLQGQAL